MNLKTILANFKIESLNEMQKATLDLIPKGNDLILISPTGSGKTLAFLLPLLELLNPEKEGLQVLILVPSRELALQIESVFKQMGTDFKINCCYGGHAIRIEKNNFLHPPAVLVGTPGRIAYHIRNENIVVREAHTLILDEFDKSLEFGFKEEMSFIVQHLTKLQRRILTSATLLKEIPSFVRLNKPIELNFTKSEEHQTNAALQIREVRAVGIDKLSALLLLIGKLGSQSKIVFCNHRDAVERISELLKSRNVEHGIYHGGLDQIDREKVLIKLRNGSIRLLLTTDLAARGLDIPEIEAIIHYQLPTTEDVMIHRNGRTARMHADGTAYFLLEEKDYLPSFLKVKPEIETLPDKFIQPKMCEWKTLYIAAGKKDKINKMDIVGMLLQKGGLKKEELGKIEVLDHSAYAAIKSNKILKTLENIGNEKIKNRKIKMEISS
ncbi:MAG TPA: DEAD/DEAH box helicase [Bacteroidia bacterium]|nr:DEAD/DEAH box helicase [Bacteroidia bacterium]